MKKNITFLLLLLFVMSNMQGQILIGNGTLEQRHVPFDASFEYSYSQTIYLASEINSSGNITSIKWYYNGSVSLANSQDLKIYLGHTTKSAFLNNTDWSPIENLQLAYTGGIVANAPGWVTITLSTPFQYNGTDNLLIATSESQPGSDFVGSSFFSNQVATKRSLCLYSNSVVPDLTAPANATSISKFVPNIVFGGISLACGTPLFVTPSAVTSSAATLTWEAPSSAPSGGSEYYISQADGNLAPTQVPTGSILSGNSVTATGLLPATTYHAWVRNVCNGIPGNWSYSTSFMTLCNPLALINENFDDPGSAWPLPTCWSSIIRGNSSSANIGVINSGAHSGNSAILIANNDADPASDIILVTPELTTLGAGTHRLKFFADGDGVNSLEIGTLNSNSADAVFNHIALVETTANYAEYTVSFTSYTGTDSYIGIRSNSINQYNPIYIDDIRWEVAPLCPDVAQIVVDPITPDTATVNWAPNGITQWQFVYGPDSATDPDSLTPETINTTATKILTGLTEDTAYKVWIRTVCGANPGFWTGPISFRSACPAVNTLIENFDSVQTPELPACWTTILRGPSVSIDAAVVTTDYNYHSAPNAIRISNAASNTTFGDDIILVSPNFGIISTKPHRVKFYARGNGEFQVGTLNGNNTNAVFTSFQAVQANDELTEYTIDFSLYTGNDTYIGFRSSSPGLFTDVYIDDVRWEEVPLCPDVMTITIPTISEDAATVTWEAGNSEILWNVVYTADTSVNDPTTLTPVTDSDTTSLNINNLEPNTTYKVWVRSVCGINNGAWIGPVPFKTACMAATELDENFDNATNGQLPDCWSKIIRGEDVSEYAGVNLAGYNAHSGPNGIEISNNASTGDYHVILVSPALSNIGTTHRLKFYAYSNEMAPLEVGTLPSNTNEAEFIDFVSITTTGTYTQYVVDFTDYTGTDSYIGIRLNGPPNISAFIDDVVWETIPLCPDVVNLTTQATTTDTATLEWESDGSGNTWQVVYGPEDATNPDLLTAQDPVELTMTTLTDLSPSTSYKFWVRTVCGGANGNGAWIGPVTFKTQCPAVNGFDENFDATPSGKLPECWSSVLRGSTLSSDARVRVISNHAVSGTHAAIIDNDNSNISDDIILVSPAIADLVTGDYTFTFKADGDDPTNFQVGTLDVNDDTATFTPFQGLMTTNEYSEFSVDLSSYSGTDTYVGIRHNDSGNFTPIYLDDLKLQPALSTGDFDNTKFAYYPNPVKNTLNLSYTKNITDVTVYNLLGQTVLSNKNDSTTSIVDMSHLPSGSYIVKVTADNQIKTLKVVKE